MRIKDLPEMEKPYEKLENYGAESLSDAELIAIILKSGTKNVTSIELAQKILKLDKDNKGLSFLKDVTLEELQKINGLGRVKAVQIKALIEIAGRFVKPRKLYRKVISTPEDVVNILENDMKDESQEIIKTLILNTQNQLIRIITNAIGSLNASIIEVRDIFREPIKSNAAKIILVHNHPSGDVTPSLSDIDFSQKMKTAGDIFGIELLDHIIIGYGAFSSLKRMKKF